MLLQCDVLDPFMTPCQLCIRKYNHYCHMCNIILAYLVHTSSYVVLHSQSTLCIWLLSGHLGMASTPGMFHYHKQTSQSGMAHKLCQSLSYTRLWCPCQAHIPCMDSKGMRYLARTRQNTIHSGRVRTLYC